MSGAAPRPDAAAPRAEPRASRPEPRVAAVILAAGLSSRMEDAHKLLLPYGGTTVVGAVVAAAAGAGLRPILAVTGHRAADVRAALEGSGVRTVENPRFAEGRSGSLAAGIAAAAAEGAAAAVVLLGDEPGIRPEAIRRVVEAWSGGGALALRARYRDRPGHPVLFDRSLFERLLARPGGGRAVAPSEEEEGEEKAPAAGVAPADVALDLDAPVDVDTRADLAAARARAPDAALPLPPAERPPP